VIVQFVIFQLVQQIDVIGIIQFEPIGDGRDRATAALGEGGEDAFAKIGIEDFADADQLRMQFTGKMRRRRRGWIYCR